MHVGDEMAAGLGALFAEKFPEVPALGVIHEGFQFSKNDSLLLFAGLDGDALVSVQCGLGIFVQVIKFVVQRTVVRTFVSPASPVSTVSIQISAETVGFRPKKTPHRRNRLRIPAQRGHPVPWWARRQPGHAVRPSNNCHRHVRTSRQRAAR